MLYGNLNLGKYKRYVQKTLLENCCQIFTIGFVAEKRTAFVNPVHNDLFTELGGMGVECKALCIMGKKSYLRSLEMPALKETQTAWTSYKRCIQI